MYIITSAISGTVGLVFLVIWIALLVVTLLNLISSKKLDRNTKVLWFAVIVVVPILGSLTYWFWLSVRRVEN
jgi:hypothetical protein